MTTHELADKQDRYVTAPGKYTAKVKAPGNGWLGTTKTGTDFIRLPLLIDDPASDQHGREIVWQGWLTEKAKGRTIKTLDAAFGKEWTLRTLASGQSPFLNQLCRITVVPEDYNGEERLKIQWLNPMAASPINEDWVAAFDKQLAAARLANEKDEF